MRSILAIIFLATSVQAGDFIRVFVDTNNAATLRRVVSFNTAEPFAPDEVARLPLLTVLPAIEPFLEWDGSQLVPMLAGASNALAASIAARRAALDLEASAPVVASKLLAVAWPILSAHPATNEVPNHGLAYRLESTNGIVTWWVARQSDLIATQLSAHDEKGDEVVRSVNLKTGVERTINLKAITEATKFSDIKDAKTEKTNDVKRAVNRE